MGDDKAVRLLKNQKERRCSLMYDFSMPLWERYLMTIEERPAISVSAKTSSAVLQMNTKKNVL